MQDHVPSEVMNALPGAGGSLIALLWLKESPARGLAMWAAGSFVAYYASSPLAAYIHLNEGVSGLFIGLFGMALVNKAFEVLQSLQLGTIVSDWIQKRLNG